MIQNIIFDFDSSCLAQEVSEFLINIGLEKFEAEEKQFRIDSLRSLAERTEAGEVSRGQKVNQQLHLAQINRKDVEKAAREIRKLLLPTVKESVRYLKSQNKQIIVFSRGFDELVYSITDSLKIPRRNVFSNNLLYDDQQQVIGVDTNNFLFLMNGKVYLAEKLKNDGRLKGKTVAVGNSGADLSIHKSGIAEYFIYVSNFLEDEHIRTEADFVIDHFEQIIPLVCSKQRSSNNLLSSLSRPKKTVVPKYKIVLLENIHPRARELFRMANHTIEAYKYSTADAELIKIASEAHILGIRSKTHLGAAELTKMRKLLGVGCYCIGTDQVDLEAAAKRGIPVFNAPYANTRSVAELVLGEVVMLMRGVFEKSVAAHDGRWLKHAKYSRELRGKTIGIIGYGHIGSQVSVLFESLGMQVLFFDINEKLPLGNARRIPTLDSLLQSSDVVTLHVPDTPLTRGMIGREELAKMKNGSILINTSRGKVVDLEALKNALDAGKLLGAAIDVYPEEPASSDASFTCVLQKRPNVILTPHIGGSTIEAQENIALEVTDKVNNFLITGASMGAVNFPELELPPTKNSFRILYVYHNVPGILAKIHTLFSEHGVIVVSQILKTKDEIGYMIADIAPKNSGHVTELLSRITETIKVRKIG